MDGDDLFQEKVGRKGENRVRAVVHPLLWDLSCIIYAIMTLYMQCYHLFFSYMNQEVELQNVKANKMIGGKGKKKKKKKTYVQQKGIESNLLIFQFSISVIKEHKHRLNHTLLTACNFCFCLDEHLFCSSGSNSAAFPENQLKKNKNPTLGSASLQRERTKAGDPSHRTEVER